MTAIAIVSLVNDENINVSELNFSGNSGAIYTNVDPEISAGLYATYATTEDENVYNISSPLNRTEYTFEDSGIAYINYLGYIQGLKEGTTLLT